MPVELTNESGVVLVESELQDVVLFGMSQMRVHPDAELAIVLVDEAAMEQLHLQWMGEPGPTDVLSFPMDELRPGRDGETSAEGILGDIVLCPTVAASQAEAAGHSVMAELSLLTIHGLLHLLGYDHAEPEEEKEMFGLQADILKKYSDQTGR
ncbi:MAG: rRNA maturation RNase YbeY [Pontimonas sp.]|nr:MAG: heat-shock protein [actinobacterium acMicro-4]MCF8523058.1 rRNA maturation RNase YbeY [Pontimonas sp.]MCF8547434.1 rRNA maturation RNase YbeY [Pontimonas sp.]